MMQNPIARRLEADFEKVQALIASSGGTLRLIRTLGQPPTTYVVEYHCPSLIRNPNGQVSVHDVHQVEIQLGVGYPLVKPNAKMLTPVFNPHVYSHNAICLGLVWSAAETLDTLILRIGALLQLDPKVLDSSSPANGDANLWVQNNRRKIPLGNVTFRAAQVPKKRIEWS